MGIREK